MGTRDSENGYKSADDDSEEEPPTLGRQGKFGDSKVRSLVDSQQSKWVAPFREGTLDLLDPSTLKKVSLADMKEIAEAAHVDVSGPEINQKKAP